MDINVLSINFTKNIFELYRIGKIEKIFSINAIKIMVLNIMPLYFFKILFLFKQYWVIRSLLTFFKPRVSPTNERVFINHLVGS